MDGEIPIKTYGHTKTSVVVWIYVVGIIVWLLIFLLLRFYRYGWGVIIFGLIPIVVFAIAICNAGEVEEQTDAKVFRLDTLAVLGVFVFLAWHQHESEDNIFWIGLLMGILFILAASYDVWTKDKWIPIVRHVRSVLTTIGLSLILLSIYIYMIEQMDDIPNQ